MQKEPVRVVLRKRCCENIQQIYRRTLMPNTFDGLLLNAALGWNRLLRGKCMTLEWILLQFDDSDMRSTSVVSLMSILNVNKVPIFFLLRNAKHFISRNVSIWRYSSRTDLFSWLYDQLLPCLLLICNQIVQSFITRECRNIFGIPRKFQVNSLKLRIDGILKKVNNRWAFLSPLQKIKCMIKSPLNGCVHIRG